MPKRKPKNVSSESYYEEPESDTTRVASGVKHGMLRHNVKCTCGHIVSMPGHTLEDAIELGKREPCDECNEKQHKDEMSAHYAWMKAYNERKKLAKEKAAKAEKKRKTAAKMSATKDSKKKNGGKSKSAGVVT